MKVLVAVVAVGTGVTTVTDAMPLCTGKSPGQPEIWNGFTGPEGILG
jgi:hypothetical protein